MDVIHQLLHKKKTESVIFPFFQAGLYIRLPNAGWIERSALVD
jgi:hypothetical protein